MGKTSSKNLKIEQTDFNDWQNVGFHRETVEIVRSVRGAGQAEIQNIPFDPKRSLQKQLEIYQYRKDQDNALVHCYGVQTNQQKVANMCGNQKVIKVITERIPKRLPDLPQITFQESLYALSQSLRGYKDCYNKLGPFQITDNMIGVNRNGEVRVWVNQDFGQNHPSMQKPVLQTTSSGRNNHFEQLTGNKDQGEMVRNIIEIVQQKCQAGRFPPQFRQRIFKNSYSFDDAYKQAQRFSLQRNLFIPQRILLDRPPYQSKQSLFTPGDQYVRNQNDPNFRPQKQALNLKQGQRLQMTRQTFPYTGGYNSTSYRSSNQSPYTYNYENKGAYGNNNNDYLNSGNNIGNGNPIKNNSNFANYGNDMTFNSSQNFNRISSQDNTNYRQSRQMPLQYNKVVFQSQPSGGFRQQN